jgi:hypothetical protein
MTKTVNGKRTATTTKQQPKSKLQKEKEKGTENMATIEQDSYDLNEAEDFKLPTGGVHDGNLSGVEDAVSKNTNKKMTVVTINLSPEDPDAPNLPMRLYLTWPVEEDRNKMYGTRNAFGAQLQSIKEVMTAFGGQESGKINPEQVLAFLSSKVGKTVKVKVKQSLRTEKDADGNNVPVEPPEMQASIVKLLPA